MKAEFTFEVKIKVSGTYYLNETKHGDEYLQVEYDADKIREQLDKKLSSKFAQSIQKSLKWKTPPVFKTEGSWSLVGFCSRFSRKLK